MVKARDARSTTRLGYEVSGSPSRLVRARAEIKSCRSHEYKRGVGVVVAAETTDGRTAAPYVVVDRRTSAHTAGTLRGSLAVLVRRPRSLRAARYAKNSSESIETIRFIDSMYNRGSLEIIRPPDACRWQEFSETVQIAR